MKQNNKENQILLQLDSLNSVLEVAKLVAKRYYELTKKPLGITGEIGEYSAAKLLGLELCEARQDGYDATSNDGRKIQIKTRRILSTTKLSQRLGSIDITKEWDSVLLVLLNEEFDPFEIYEVDRQAVEEAILEPGSKARNERGQLGIGKFKSIGTLLWSVGINKAA